MKTADISEAQRHLPEFIESGDELAITKENRVIAKLVPMPATGTVVWPDISKRLHAIYGNRDLGKPASEIICEDRQERG